jgi:hypothetical protein
MRKAQKGKQAGLAEIDSLDRNSRWKEMRIMESGDRLLECESQERSEKPKGHVLEFLSYDHCWCLKALQRRPNGISMCVGPDLELTRLEGGQSRRNPLQRNNKRISAPSF